MLNLLVQVATLLKGLMMNFLFPGLYGLESYGSFIQTNALLFLLHKTISIVSEPLIHFSEPRRIFCTSLALNGLLFLIFCAANYWLPLGSPLLLAGMLGNYSVLLALQAMRMHKSFIGVQLGTVLIFTALSLYSALHAFSISIATVMEAAMLLPTLGGALMLVIQRAAILSLPALRTSLRQMAQQVPQLLSITAAMNLFTNALPLILAYTLGARDLGLFRVSVSVIQSASSLFPLSTQALLAGFVRHEREGHDGSHYAALRDFSILYFSAAGVGLLLLTLLMPNLAAYAALACCLPVYYLAVIAERHLTAMHRVRRLMVVNGLVCLIAACTLPFVTHLAQGQALFITGLTAYALLLCLSIRLRRLSRAPLWLIALCPLAVYATGLSTWAGIAYLLLLALLTYRQHPAMPKEIRRVLGAM